MGITRDKRGELTSQEIVVWTMAILGFLIILAVVFYLYTVNNTSDADACHFSVLTRATVQSVAGGAQSYVPLTCKAKKICLTDGSGECEDAFAGGNDVAIVKLPNFKVGDFESMKKAADLINSRSANEMLSCWNMLGQGKLSLFGNFGKALGWDAAGSTCVVCSRVALDLEPDKLKAISEFMADPEKGASLQEFLLKKAAPGGKGRTYMQVFSDSNTQSYAKVSPVLYSDIDKASNLEGVDKTKANALKTTLEGASNVIGSDEKFNYQNTETAVLFMQIKPEKYEDVLLSLAKLGVVTVGGVAMMPVIGSGARAMLMNPYVLGASVAAAGAYTGYAMSNVHKGRMAAVSYCGAVTSSESDKDEVKKGGCSTVQVTPYVPSYINEICTNLEGQV